MSNQETKQLNMDDMTPQQSLEAIWTMMNRAASKGVFTIDESYILKVLFSKISNSIPKDENKDENKEQVSDTNYNV